MSRRGWLAVGLVGLIFVPWYLAVGVGYERLQRACFNSRHSIDDEGRVGDGLGIVLWPLELPLAVSQSCLPVKIGDSSRPS